MKRPLAGTLAAGLLGAAALTGLAATPAAATSADAQQHRPTSASSPHNAAAPDFEGSVALSNCSGSLVSLPDSQPSDPALVLSNGHCLEAGMPGPGTVVVDEPSSRGFTLLDASGQDAGTVSAVKVAYATMTDTDVSLYQVGESYEEIESEYGVTALDLDAEHPVAGNDITVVSGYWKETFGCAIDAFVPELREADWTMKDSLRYTAECETKGGTSGSPVVDDASGKVVGVNNTRNENGEECTLDNPCEVDEDGNVTVREGIAYGQQTYLLAACVGKGNEVDLDLEGCTLPKP
ncbi:S1 family peptidase [Streptomyces sulphureus]|uniref:S1 family peptidase n=1 Tax=Streptomyces sulphureus TaxID=47758 RepID=UPI000361434B|nr:serine protease [Streptomyces sulphureus]